MYLETEENEKEGATHPFKKKTCGAIFIRLNIHIYTHTYSGLTVELDSIVRTCDGQRHHERDKNKLVENTSFVHDVFRFEQMFAVLSRDESFAEIDKR